MKSFLVKYTDFQGIVESMAEPGITTFKTLINLRADLRLGGLTNRLGVRNPLADDRTVLTFPTTRVDAITFNDFNDIRSMLVLGDASIQARPAWYGGIDTGSDRTYDIFRNLTETIRVFNDGGSAGNPASGFLRINTNPVVQGPYSVRGKARVSGVAVLGDDPHQPTYFTIDLKVGDILVLSRTGEILPERTIFFIQNDSDLMVDHPYDGFVLPEYYSIAYKTATYTQPSIGQTLTIGSNVYSFVASRSAAFQITIGTTSRETCQNIVSAINTDDTVVTAWTDGVVTVRVTARINGAFGNSIIFTTTSSALVMSGATLQNGVDPTSGMSLISVSGNTITLSNGVYPNGRFKYMIVRNVSLDPHEFAVVKSVIGEYPAGPTLTLSRTVDDTWSAGDQLVFYANDLQASIPDLTYDTGLTLSYDTLTRPQFQSINGNNNLLLFGIAEKLYGKNLWIGRIKDRNYFGIGTNSFSFNGIYCTSQMENFSHGVFSPTTHHLDVKVDTASNLEVPIASPPIPNTGLPSYNFWVFNLSLILDDANETSLLFSDTYGGSPSESTVYEDMNVGAIQVDNPNKRVFVVKISLPRGETINRRLVEIRIYAQLSRAIRLASTRRDPGGAVFEGLDAWRQCKRVSLDSSAWSYDATTNTYYAEVRVSGSDINGELYIDRTGQGISDNLVQKSYYGTFLNQRTFIRNEVDKETVYFSPINSNGVASSCLPSSNWFVLNKIAGEIVGLFSINSKLLVFKKFSYFTVSTEALPDSIRDDYISVEHGLASLASVASGQRYLFFNSYDGIYVTDGFKDQLINQAWIEEYRDLLDSEKEAAVGFFDSYSDSYFIFIGGTLWAYDVKTTQWRQEDYSHIVGTQTYGIVGYNAKRFDGRTIFVGASDSNFYEYPRADQLYYDSYNGTNHNVQCDLETNLYEPETGQEELTYPNRGYLIGENIEAGGIMTLSLKRDAILKSVTIAGSRVVFPFNLRTPLDRFTILCSFSTAVKLTIIEFGLYMKSLMRAGSVKVSS